MQFVLEMLMNENRLVTDEGLVMSRRVPKHAARVMVVSDAVAKHVDAHSSTGVSHSPRPMTNVSNALIWNVKDEEKMSRA